MCSAFRIWASSIPIDSSKSCYFDPIALTYKPESDNKATPQHHSLPATSDARQFSRFTYLTFLTLFQQQQLQTDKLGYSVR